VLARAPGASPAAVLAAVAAGLRAPPAPAPARAAAGGWTAPAAGDAAAAPARVAALLRVPGGAAAGAAGVAAALEARAAAPRARAPRARAGAAAGALPPPAPVAFAAAGTVALEYAGAALAAGDFDGDGARDLVVTAYGASPVGAYADDAVGLPRAVGAAQGVLPQAGGWYTRAGGARAAAARAAAAGPEPLAPAARSLGASVYARLGEAACALDFNGDGVDDLAVGAPTAGWAWSRDPWDETPLFYYQGRVEVFFGRRGAGLPGAAAPDVVILPAANLSFVGGALECDADLDGDGLPDLVVGSPFWGPAAGGDAGANRQRGRVDVFFSGGAWRGAVALDDANVTVLGPAPWAWAGAAVAGWANASALGVTPREAARAALGARAGESDAAAAARAPPACAAAAAAALAAAAAPVALLLVGAPGAPAAGAAPPYAAVRGRLAGYAIPASASAAGALAACTRAPPAALFSLVADVAGVTAKAAPKLGAAVAVGLPLGAAGGAHVAVGMPDVDACNSTALLPGVNAFATAAGAVGVFPLSPALRGDVAWSALPARARLFSAQPDARFGARLGFRAALNATRAAGGGAQDLLVGAPLFSRLFLGAADGPAPTPAGDSGREVGALFLFRGGAAFPAGDACAAEARAAWWAEGAAEHGRLGSAWAFADWNADGEEDLVAAAPRAALDVAGARGAAAAAAPEHAGVLQVYQL